MNSFPSGGGTAASRAEFMHADRRCRNVSAAARDFLKRAAALRAIGDSTGAAADLAIAIERDPTDFAVNLAALRCRSQVKFASRCHCLRSVDEMKPGVPKSHMKFGSGFAD